MPTRITNDSFRWYYASIYLGLALIFGSQYFTYKNVRDLSLNNERLNVTIGVLNQTANFGLVTKDFQSNMRGYLITQNNALLADNYNKKIQLVGITDTLFNLVKGDEVQARRVRELLEISSQIVAYSQNVISIYRTQGSSQAFTKIQEGEGIRLNNLLTRKINEIDDSENHNMDQRRKLVSATQQNSILFILLTGAVGFILTILSIVFLNLDKRKQRLLQMEINERERTVTQDLEAIPDGVMVINNERKIEVLNQSGREILGVAGERPETLEEQVKRIKLLDPTHFHVRFSADTLPVARA